MSKKKDNWDILEKINIFAVGFIIGGGYGYYYSLENPDALYEKTVLMCEKAWHEAARQVHTRPLQGAIDEN